MIVSFTITIAISRSSIGERREGHAAGLSSVSGRLSASVERQSATTTPARPEVSRVVAPATPSADCSTAGCAGRELKAKLDAAHHDANLEAGIPTIEEIVAGVLDVESRLKDDPTGAREALRRLVLDGAIHMAPQDDGSYRARSFLLPENLANKSRKPRAGQPSGASGVSHEVVGNGGCAGAIHPVFYEMGIELNVRLAA
jgi:hypothetical protein